MPEFKLDYAEDLLETMKSKNFLFRNSSNNEDVNYTRIRIAKLAWWRYFETRYINLKEYQVAKALKECKSIMNNIDSDSLEYEFQEAREYGIYAAAEGANYHDLVCDSFNEFLKDTMDTYLGMFGCVPHYDIEFARQVYLPSDIKMIVNKLKDNEITLEKITNEYDKIIKKKYKNGKIMHSLTIDQNLDREELDIILKTVTEINGNLNIYLKSRVFDDNYGYDIDVYGYGNMFEYKKCENLKLNFEKLKKITGKISIETNIISDIYLPKLRSIPDIFVDYDNVADDTDFDAEFYEDYKGLKIHFGEQKIEDKDENKNDENDKTKIESNSNLL